ncbi:MAG: tetratricopeptide repeat protein [Actinobacteria bacterium]|nr:tetratricopeptide repeat protein [Actinomycetota bacterium]
MSSTEPATIAFDVTDADFETAVVERSMHTPVVVDLWAPWCGPCRTLGPILEDVIAATEGRVVLAKVNVDDNPAVADAFQVQGIPAVYALRDGRVVDGFIGAQGRAHVQAFVERLLPSPEESEADRLVAAGDEASLRQALALDPDHEGATVALAELLAGDGRSDEALAALARIPESAETRRVAAIARTGQDAPPDDVEARLDGLLDRVKDDESARQEFLDVLELLGPDDPRTARYRRLLTSRLF